MGIPICVVDAFASERFRGNPAGVCTLPAPASVDWMQQVAAELNLSETAFLRPREEGWEVRWFTPVTEVALCGHATLASAHVLWESARVAPATPIIFHALQSGPLACIQGAMGIEMDFPAHRPQPVTPPDGLIQALGCDIKWCGRTSDDYLVEVGHEAIVRGLKPDFRALAELPVRGVIVTARGLGGFDFVSRFFAPAAGVLEDPVTGSAHCSLAPYWATILGRAKLRAWQASARGGEVQVE